MLTLQIKEKEIENLTPEEEFVRGTVGAKCQINFDEFWQSYNKYIVFKRVGYEPINFMVDTLENEIEIPYTILAESGEFKIGVFGTTETETLPTLYSKDIKILYGTDTHGTTPPTYIPSEIDQLRLSKQDRLVSGENIKTVNGESVLGSGNIKIQVEVDQTYSPTSANAQSGKAVAEALSGYVMAEVGKGLSSNDFTNEDKEKLYSALQNENIDKTYNPTSENAQSGKAVAEAVSAEQKRADNTFSNALKGTISDTAMLLDDVSPVTHEMGVKVRSKNLIPYPYAETRSTINGITVTYDEDGSIIFNGTAGSNVYFKVFERVKFPAGKYYLSGTPTDGGAKVAFLYFFETDNPSTTYNAYTTNGVACSLSGTEYSGRIYIANGQTVENLVFKPQLELGTSATPYTPYVPDLTAVKVSRCGKNLFDKDNANILNTYFTTSGVLNTNSTTTRSVWIPCSPNTTYTVSKIASARFAVGFTNEEPMNGVTVNNVTFLPTATKITVTSGNSDKYIIVWFYHSSHDTSVTVEEILASMQIELGTTATDYEPYKECVEYTPNADGTVNGITSLYPNTTLMTDTEGVIIDCEYNRDINKAFAELQQAIISLGGNI